MANLNPTPGWAAVTELPASTTAMGGPGGPMNLQAQQLLNMLDYLRLGMARVVDTIAALKAVDKSLHTRVFVAGYYAAGDGGGGEYRLDSGDTTTADNGGTVIVATDGGRWKLLLTGSVSVKQFGAVLDGVADDTASLVATATAARTAMLGSSDRIVAGNVYIPPGIMKITSAVQLAPVAGLIGLKIIGAGMGVSVVLFAGGPATLSARSSAYISFEDLEFRSAGVDVEQSAFSITASGNPLRYWTFRNCVFTAFYKCFSVTGAALCSEFSFIKCRFSDCYHLMDNHNEQAVNWNFLDSDWENSGLSTSKDKHLSAIFMLQKGTFTKWSGGSIIGHGLLAYFNLTASGAFLRTAHKIAFGGVRLELDDDGAGGHAPLLDKASIGYVTGSNAPTVTLRSFSILNRGAIPANTTYFKVWDNCSLSLEDGETEGGKVVGVLSANTPSQNADIRIVDVRGVSYEEDVTNRLNTHDQHNVHIEPDNSTAGNSPIVDHRNCGLSNVWTTTSKLMAVRGPTGSLPQGGTNVSLPGLPGHFFALKLFCYRLTAASHSLTVELRDQADTTSYGSVALSAADSNKETFILKEIGFQVPAGTALMLKFTGTAEVVKGVVGIEYL